MGRNKVNLFFTLITCAAFLFSGLPYLFAQSMSNEGVVFGGLLLNTQDGNSYLAKMYQGWQGAWLFTLPFTAESARPEAGGAFLFSYYLLLGHIARGLGISLLAVFHLARLIAVLFLLYRLQRFLAHCLEDEKSLRTAFFVAALGGGLGWLALPFGAFTADFWVAEGYPFLSGFVNPHFPLALALILSLLTPSVEYQASLESGSGGSPGRHGLMSGLYAFMLSLISPFGVVLVLGVKTLLTGWDLWERKPLRLVLFRAIPLFAAGLGGLPMLFYVLWVTRVDPLLAAWNTQNVTASPPFWDTLLSLSPSLLLALPGAWLVLKELPRSTGVPRSTGGTETVSAMRAVLLWAGLGLALMYFPWPLQRRFMIGLWVPLTALAAYGLAGWKTRPRLKNILTVLWVSLALPTNLIALIAIQGAVSQHQPALYLSRSELAAMDWIADRTPLQAVILAGSESGSYLPAHTGRRVIYGHPYETVNAPAKQAAVVAFLSDPAVIFTNSLLAPASLIYISRRDVPTDTLSMPVTFPILYTNEEVTIYQVVR